MSEVSYCKAPGILEIKDLGESVYRMAFNDVERQLMEGIIVDYSAPGIKRLRYQCRGEGCTIYWNDEFISAVALKDCEMELYLVSNLILAASLMPPPGDPELQRWDEAALRNERDRIVLFPNED